MQINIEKRHFLIILGVMFLLAGTLVYAYGGTSPTNVGHTAAQISDSCSWFTLFSDTHTYTNTHVYDHVCPGGKVLKGMRVYYRDWTGGNAAEGTSVNSLYCCG